MAIHPPQAGKKRALSQLCMGALTILFSVILIGVASVGTLSSKLQVSWASLELRAAFKGKGWEDPCQAGWRANLREHVRRVVLIVNYGDEERANASSALLLRLYAPFFDKIVHLAPAALREHGAEARGLDPFYSSGQYFAYLAVQRVIRENPEAEGFFYMADDVALNYWHLIGANKSRIWVRRFSGRSFPFNHKIKSNFSDDWADRREHRMSAWRAFKGMDPLLKRQFCRSMAPHKRMFPKQVVDLVYLPRNHSIVLAENLIPLFIQHKVRWEIALPMMLFSIQHPAEYDSVLDDMGDGGEGRGEAGGEYDPLQFWSPQISALHPWNLTTATSKLGYLKALGKVDPCVTLLEDVIMQDSSMMAAQHPWTHKL